MLIFLMIMIGLLLAMQIYVQYLVADVNGIKGISFNKSIKWGNKLGFFIVPIAVLIPSIVIGIFYPTVILGAFLCLIIETYLGTFLYLYFLKEKGKNPLIANKFFKINLIID